MLLSRSFSSSISPFVRILAVGGAEIGLPDHRCPDSDGGALYLSLVLYERSRGLRIAYIQHRGHFHAISLSLPFASLTPMCGCALIRPECRGRGKE